MGNINVNSLATAVGSSVNNVSFGIVGENVPRKILIIASYDPLKTLVVDNVPVQIFSPEDAAGKFGFGSMAHRLAIEAFKGSDGVETWISPQPEAGGAVAAAGDINFTASGLLAGTVSLYIAGDAVPFTVAAGDDSDAVATKAAAAINADDNLPVTAVVNVTPNIIDITAKTKGTYGNDLSIEFDLNASDVTPTGLTSVVTEMTGGTGTPTIQDALDGLGVSDDANSNFFTDVVHGYLQDTTTLDAISAYVGAGNEKTGLYSETVSRPFRVLTGDVVAGSAGLTALIAFGNGRKLDRANGVIAVPDSPNHPSEIAAQAIGHMARVNSSVAAQSYNGITLKGIFPGVDRWTSDYANRDLASKAGVSPTKFANGVIVMQNMFTFYHPDNVPSDSNGYRAMVNIAKLQNIMDNIRLNFERPEWQGVFIVEDVTKVTSSADKTKARGLNAVRNDMLSLAEVFVSKGWIFNLEKTIEGLIVTLRAGGNGFDVQFPIVLSGQGDIIDVTTNFDTSIVSLS